MAQEREKRRIVIASILKPVDDTRMFEKMGCTLARNGFEVFIVGFGNSGESHVPGTHFVPLGKFQRISFQRWWARWKVLIAAIKRRPDVLVFTTHELLLPAFVLKVILNTKIIYDVRENYFRNIRHSESLPWLVRSPLAYLVRMKEKLIAPVCDYFFLAEKGYEKEIKFHRGGWTVLENKATPGVARRSAKQNPGSIDLLFTGTLAESTGVFRAIQLAIDLHKLNPAVRLTIAGYAATRHVQNEIRKGTQACEFIRLLGIETLVPHTEIIKLIVESDAGIIAYVPSPATLNSIPTKLFEYLQAGLPIITESRWPWIQRFGACGPFAMYDFGNQDPPSLLRTLINGSFYRTQPGDTSWQSEEAKLLEAIKNIV